MADNKKQEKDFTKEVDALLPEADATIQVLQSFNEITTLDWLFSSLVNSKKA